MILACDLGGSSFRAALLDRDGRTHASAACKINSSGPDGIEPEDWWTALQEIAGSLGDLGEVEALAISGFTRTQVFLDADMHSLRPAIPWHDARATTPLPLGDDPELAQVNPFHPLARLAWLAEHEPQHAAALAAVVEPKDFLNLRLTGICAIDSVGSARLIAGRALLPALGYSPAILPPAIEPTAILGVVRPGLPGALAELAGRPVLTMATDTWASVVGLGALRDGCGYNLSGTTEVLGVIANADHRSDGLLTVPYGPGLFQIGGPSQCGGDTLLWLLALLGRPASDVGNALDALLAEPRDPAPMIFLPYLMGERTPHWDPDLRGAFIGMNRRHGAGDCTFAVLQGIACLNRLVLERAEGATARTVDEIRFGGGGAASAAWCQIKADITGRDIVTTEAAETGLLGAAIVAFTALGSFADLTAAQAAMVRERRRFRPRTTSMHTRSYEMFRAAEAAIAPVSRALAAA